MESTSLESCSSVSWFIFARIAIIFYSKILDSTTLNSDNVPGTVTEKLIQLAYIFNSLSWFVLVKLHLFCSLG